MIGKIESIQHYGSTYELLDEFCDCEVLLDLSEDERHALQHVDDFEGLTFYVINSETVIVCETFGTIEGDEMTVDDFTRNAIEYVKEWCKDE